MLRAMAARIKKKTKNKKERYENLCRRRCRTEKKESGYRISAMFPMFAVTLPLPQRQQRYLNKKPLNDVLGKKKKIGDLYSALIKISTTRFTIAMYKLKHLLKGTA